MANTEKDFNIKKTKPTTASIQAVSLAAIGRNNELLEKEKDNWKNNCRFWQIGCGALLVANIVLGSHIFKQETVYFGQVTDGKSTWVVPLFNLRNPVVNKATVVNFAAEAASVALTHSFATWKKDLSKFDNYFLPKASYDLKESLVSTNFFKRLEETSTITTAVPTSAPIIVGEQSDVSSYGWKLEFSMLVTWQGQSSHQETVNIKMIIRQVQALQNPRGIMVENINIY